MPITSHGTTIAFATSNFTGEITNLTPPGSTRESIPTTHAGTTGAKTFMPGDLPDNGELQFTLHFDPSEDPPIDQDPEQITITFNDGSSWVFTGFMTASEPTGTATEGDEKIEMDVTVKVSGTIQRTGAGS